MAMSLTNCQTPMSLGRRCPGAAQATKDVVGVVKKIDGTFVFKSDYS